MVEVLKVDERVEVECVVVIVVEDAEPLEVLVRVEVGVVKDEVELWPSVVDAEDSVFVRVSHRSAATMATTEIAIRTATPRARVVRTLFRPALIPTRRIGLL